MIVSLHISNKIRSKEIDRGYYKAATIPQKREAIENAHVNAVEKEAPIWVNNEAC